MNKLSILINKILVCTAAFLIRSCPNLPGRWRLLKKIQVYAKEVYKHKSPVTIKLICGYKMIVDRQDHVGRHIFLTGQYEESTTNVFEYLLSPGDIVLDVGANIGYFTLLSRSCVGSKGVVYAFEASPETSILLKENININKLSNVIIYNNAVVDNNKDIVFNVSNDTHLGISSIREIDNFDSKIIVQGISIDSLCEDIKKVNLIKIDIEGAEHLALLGMRHLIARDNPFIVIELTDGFLKDLGSSAVEVLELLYQLEYSCYEITWSGLSPIDEIIPDQCNILAVPCCVDLRKIINHTIL